MSSNSLVQNQSQDFRREGSIFDLMQNLPVGVLSLDINGQYVFANDKWCELFSCTIKHLTDNEWISILPVEQQTLFYPKWKDAIKTNQRFSFECQFRDDMWFQLHVEINNVDGIFVGYLITAEDVSTRKQNELRLYNCAYKDHLTGLYNRAFFDDQLSHYIRRFVDERTSFGLAVIDVDNFKQINDKFGHDVGDEVISLVGKRLQSMVLEHPGVVARWGGDEFVVLWPVYDRRPEDESAFTQCDAFMSKVFSDPKRNDYILTNGKKIQCSLSVGIAFCDNDTITAIDIFRKADKAMLQTKIKGKDTYYIVE